MRSFIVNYFPFLGKYKRLFIAFYHFIITKASYSQHNEDLFFIEVANNFNLNFDKYTYVDIGANHPTDISNTYLLYKYGMCGLIVEPNIEFFNLFSLIRKRDIFLKIGLSNERSISKFFLSRTPVISSFKNNWLSEKFYKTELVPILTLNDLDTLITKPIFLISIDVEGLNLQVLEGGLKVLNKTILLSVEFDDSDEKDKIIKLISSNFDLLHIFGCNLIFINKNADQHN